MPGAIRTGELMGGDKIIMGLGNGQLAGVVSITAGTIPDVGQVMENLFVGSGAQGTHKYRTSIIGQNGCRNGIAVPVATRGFRLTAKIAEMGESK